MRTSFSPKDFGTGRWDGGPGTITNPHFFYRDADFGNGPEKMVALDLTYLDPQGGEHIARFDVGNTQTRAGEQILVIRAAADDGADEAEIGPSFSHIDIDKVYKVSPKSEFGMFIASLVSTGFSESKLESGDISVLDGLEVIVTPKPKKEGDRFPLLLPTDRPKKGTSANAKPVVKPAPTAPKRTEEPEEDSSDEDPTTTAARDFMLGLIGENGEEPIPVGKVITAATQHFKGDKKLMAKVVPLIQKSEFHDQFTDFWKFDKKTKKVSAIS